MSFVLKQGDWIERLREMADESAHCCVTSPPYWGLRDYGTAGQLGLEATPEEYIAKMVKGFREVRRVLRSDGTLWMNMGDLYARNGGQQGGGNRELLHMEGKQQRMKRIPRGSGRWGGGNAVVSQLKEKDLVGMPWRVAFALQADGWYLRSDIIWAKPNPMPESVTDRPTKAHEYIFLLTKSSRYFYDAEAIKEPCTGNAHRRSAAASEYPGDENRRRPGVNPKCYNGSSFTKGKTADPRARVNVGHGERRAHYLNKNEQSGDRKKVGFNARWDEREATRSRQNPSFSEAVHDFVESRNKRSVWEIPTHPYPEAHFATFPPKLVEPCILAGTSEKGCCPKCGAPWERVLEQFDTGKLQKMADGWDTAEGGHGTVHRNGRESGETGKAVLGSKTVGWQPTCECREWKIPSCMSGAGPYEAIPGPIPCTVLDPFSGAGTTGLVATRLHRDFIGIELNPEYLEMSKRRIEQDAPLFNLQAIETTS